MASMHERNPSGEQGKLGIEHLDFDQTIGDFLMDTATASNGPQRPPDLDPPTDRDHFDVASLPDKPKLDSGGGEAALGGPDANTKAHLFHLAA